MIAAPPVDLDAIKCWHTDNLAFQRQVTDYYHDNVFVRTGIKPSRAAKAIAKSYELMEQFYGREQSRRFIHGAEMRIHAHHLVWGLQTDQKRIIERTIDPSSFHTPFAITLYDHDLNRLCKACVLWPGTPALDQAVGFLLATANPEAELDLLQQTNVSLVTPVGRKHPLLLEKCCEGDRYLDEPFDLRQEAELRVIDTPINVDDVDFEARFEASVEARVQQRHERRLQDQVIQNVQRMLFDRIDAPPVIFDAIMMSPFHSRRWNQRKVTENLPERVVRYITTKTFD
jgi:hypothetical protein